ncbi:hypothetical protein YC2023_058665 [Brassica napus]
MEVVPESSSEAPLTPTTVESEGSPNALVIMSELSSAAPLEFSKMDSESVKASKDVVNTSVSPLLATADAKTGSLSSQSAIDSKDATDVAKIHDLGALSVSSDRLVSDTITILEAQENDLQKLQAPVNAQQEAVLNSGSEATETLAAKGTSLGSFVQTESIYRTWKTTPDAESSSRDQHDEFLNTLNQRGGPSKWASEITWRKQAEVHNTRLRSLHTTRRLKTITASE